MQMRKVCMKKLVAIIEKQIYNLENIIIMNTSLLLEISCDVIIIIYIYTIYIYIYIYIYVIEERHS